MALGGMLVWHPAGFANGQGNISEYSYSGQLLGVFASPAPGGFTEATAFTHVPCTGRPAWTWLGLPW